MGMENRGSSLLEAIAYGDAAGLPVETFSAETIRRKYGWVDRLLPTYANPYFANQLQPGSWSDDTQLSIAVAEALIEAGEFDMVSMAKTHMKAYDECIKIEKHGKRVPRGWGGSTCNSVERLKRGAGPAEAGEPEGVGNGVLMKMAPLVLWQALLNVPEEQRHRQYDELTIMTHNSDIAKLCSRVHGDVLYALQTNNEQDFATNAIVSALKHEKALGLLGKLSSSLAYITVGTKQIAVQHVLRNTDGKGFYAPQTLAMVYGVFANVHGSFADKVYMAVNCGGDTDSTASIIAAMEYMRLHEVALPNDAKMLQERERLRHLSSSLMRLAKKH